MDDLFALLDEVVAGLGDADSLPMDISFDDETHWAPVKVSDQQPDQQPGELAGLLELADAPPTGDAAVVDGIKWAEFPNPFLDGALSATGDSGAP